ncbi:DUF397 domain-containing protein [Streptomyces jumonjinensis]|uniref:DUF397 domain-containing protein n=1 Tax=Streptomyces jumonjinensis TaxID=1945 RepID=UPI00378DD2CD
MSITPGPGPMRWVKSTYSGGDGGQCIEWAPAMAATTRVVPIRDSKRPAGPSLAVSAEAFAGLVAMARTADV